MRTARDFYERFVQQDPDDPDLQAELGRAYARLGQITSVLESTPRALEHYQKMGAIFERLHERYPDNPVYHQELAESCLRQGDSRRSGAGTIAQAEAAFQHSRKLQEELIRAHPAEVGYHHDLARSLRHLGNLYLFVMSNHGQAEDVLLAARQIYDRLPATYLRQPTVQFEHALALLNLAKLYAHTDRPEQHRAASEAAIALFEPLVCTHAGDPDYVLYLTDALSELGDSYRSLARPDLAQATLEKALNSAQELARSHPANGYYRHLVADAAYNLASLYYHERQEPARARVLLQKALDIEQELVVSFPAVSEYMFYLNNILRDFRDWFDDTARLNAVGQHFAVAIQEHEARFPAGKRDRDFLNTHYRYRGETHRLLAQYTEAVAEFNQAGCTDLATVPAAVVAAQRGDYDQAGSAAMTIAQNDRQGNGPGLYRAAQLGATLAAVVRNDRSLAAARREELGEKFCRQAVQWLQKAHALKYFSTPSTRYLLADDRELDPLRHRADFQAFLTRAHQAPRTGKSGLATH